MTRRIVAVDPGKMTGMCCFEWDGKGTEPVLIWSKELTEEEVAYPIRWELEHHPDVEIVCERFTINAETAKKTQAPFSLELIGVIRQCLQDAGRARDSLPLQAPSDAKRVFPNPTLKKLGYWHKGGAGHAMDSIRHGLLYLMKSGWPPKGILS